MFQRNKFDGRRENNLSQSFLSPQTLIYRNNYRITQWNLPLCTNRIKKNKIEKMIYLKSKGAVKRLLRFIYYLYKQLIALTINWSNSIQSLRHYRLMSRHYHMNRYMSRCHHCHRYCLNYLNCYCLSYCCLNLFHSLMLL